MKLVYFSEAKWNPGRTSHFPWEVKTGDQFISGHDTLEAAMRYHPDAYVTRAALDAYALRVETLTAGRIAKAPR